MIGLFRIINILQYYTVLYNAYHRLIIFSENRNNLKNFRRGKFRWFSLVGTVPKII